MRRFGWADARQPGWFGRNIGVGCRPASSEGTNKPYDGRLKGV